MRKQKRRQQRRWFRLPSQPRYKSEGRRPKSERRPKFEIRTVGKPTTEGRNMEAEKCGGEETATEGRTECCLLGFRASAFFRPSDFGLRVWVTPGFFHLPAQAPESAIFFDF